MAPPLFGALFPENMQLLIFVTLLANPANIAPPEVVPASTLPPDKVSPFKLTVISPSWLWCSKSKSLSSQPAAVLIIVVAAPAPFNVIVLVPAIAEAFISKSPVAEPFSALPTMDSV